jgi:hypothetical protein
MPKKHQNNPRSGQKRPQNDQKSDPERQDDKRTEPRRFQERLGRPRALQTPVWWHPWGAIWEAKSAPKRNQKQSKIEAKNQQSKKTIQDDLGPILGRSWAVSEPQLGSKNVPNRYKTYGFVDNHVFDVKTVRRRLWDQLWPTKAPK